MSPQNTWSIRLSLIVRLFLVCLALSGCGYSDELSHRHKLLKLLWTEQYQELDQAIADAYGERRKGKLSSNQLRTRFWQLQHADTSFAGRFDQWVSRQDSAHAYLARGWFRLQQASKARGDGSLGGVSPDRLATMQSMLQAGTEDLRQALLRDPLCAMCVGGEIYANIYLGERDPSLIEKALSIDPKLWQPFAAHLISLSPQWGGSDEEMSAFISSMQERGSSKEIMDHLHALRYFQLGVAEQYGRSGSDKAIELYERALSYAPNSDALKNVAELYAARGWHAKAEAALERNLRENDEWDLYTIEALARVYFAQGKTREGEKMNRKREELISRFRRGE
jgi:tetratricopeptide (TPR) repeat protein